MPHTPPDVDELRRLATHARDGHHALGIDLPPTTFVTVHHATLTALCDALDQDQVNRAVAGGKGTLPSGWLAELGAAVGQLNAVVDTRNQPLRDAATRIGRLYHQARDALSS